MKREELEREAVRKSLSYNTKYSEDGDFEDMLSRPQDFVEGSIARVADLLRKKAYRDGMVDGAEFGYNKAFVEADKNLKAVVADFNKSKEWHYVKDEKDLPTDKKEYLLLLGSNIRTFGFYNGKFWESWKGDFSWQEVKAYFFVPVPELKEEK